MIYPASDLRDLSFLIDSIKTAVFSVSTQYKFLKINKVVKEELALMEEQELLLIAAYGEKKEDGNFITTEDGGIKIADDKVDECAAKMKEIVSRQIQFPDIYFSIEELEELKFNLGELALLEPFIK